MTLSLFALFALFALNIFVFLPQRPNIIFISF